MVLTDWAAAKKEVEFLRFRVIACALRPPRVAALDSQNASGENPDLMQTLFGDVETEEKTGTSPDLPPKSPPRAARRSPLSIHRALP
jgi:hypothetical protein